ncbi:MAG TPA: TatD family deoxyribonuclease [Chromatiaceae bacterium]|nr:TatD family deoxyribonuclease [Chromatiaceae bacterium]
MNENIIDSHCHLDMPAFDQDRQQVLAHARAAGVMGFVVPGTTQASWQKILDLSDQEKDIYPALGLHPYFCSEHNISQVEQLQTLAGKMRPVAIGEIGLDFFRPDIDQELQLMLFELQLRVAQDLALPVILHTRKAHDQVLKLLKKYPVEGGISHAFNGSWQQARQYMDMGFCLGFGGMLTYERSTRLRALAAKLPLEHLVLETDAPDMPGSAHQYQRNSPEYLPEVLDALEEIRDEDRATIAFNTTINACRALNLPDKTRPIPDPQDV